MGVDEFHLVQLMNYTTYTHSISSNLQLLRDILNLEHKKKLLQFCYAFTLTNQTTINKLV